MSNEDLYRYIRQARAGNKKAFEKIYTETYKEAYMIAFSMVNDKSSIEDIIHDVYVKILVGLPDLKSESSFRAWFKRIVSNTCKDYMIKKRPDLFSSYNSDEFDEDFDQRIVDSKSVEQSLQAKLETSETAEKVRAAIDKLPEEQKICILMHYYSEMKVDEIANALNVSRNTVLSRLSYARKKLKKELGEEDKDDRFFGAALFPYIESLKIAPEAMVIEASSELLATLFETTAAAELFSLAAAGTLAKTAGLTLLQKVLIAVSVIAVAGGTAALVYSGIKDKIIAKTPPAITVTAEAEKPAEQEITEETPQNNNYYGEKLVLKADGAAFFSSNSSVYKAESGFENKRMIAEGNALNFVSDGRYVYFISGSKIHQYDVNEDKIIKSKSTEGEYVAFSGKSLYSVSVKNKEIYKLNASLEEADKSFIQGNNIEFLNNSLTFYRQSDMYYLSFDDSDLTPKRVVDGSKMHSMKLKTQVKNGYVYYSEFDSDETGKIAVNTTYGAPHGSIKLKEGFTDFYICNGKVLYTGVDGFLHKADLNGKNDSIISKNAYSIMGYSDSFALCYLAKKDISVLINIESGEIYNLTEGYAEEVRLDSGFAFYRVNNLSYYKEF